LFLAGVEQREIYEVNIKRMLEECPMEEGGHSLRVALRGMEISNLLGFKQDARITNWILGLIHDEAKLKLKEYYPENIPYDNKESKEYKQHLKVFMRGHVDAKNICLEWGNMLSSAAEQHHKYQERKYPAKLKLPVTKESRLLSKILAPSDFLDAVSSRPCKLTGKYHSPDEIIDLTLKEYGNLRIKYNGELFPKIDINGAELIYELQKRGFAGRERPENISEENFRMNPFVGLEVK
jgi:hypothetical protein